MTSNVSNQKPLHARLVHDLVDGLSPVTVCTNAETVSTGAIDPLKNWPISASRGAYGFISMPPMVELRSSH